MLFLLLAALCCLVRAAPFIKRTAICPIEDLPWTISNIVVYTADKSVPTTTMTKDGGGMDMGTAGDTTFLNESFIDFTFCDSNEGLELEMECSRFTNGSLLDDEKFYPCDERGVVFRFGKEGLEVQRAFKSPW